MEFFEEMIRDMDFRRPRVIVTDEVVILENVANIVMLSETAVTVSHGLSGASVRRSGKPEKTVFTTITGDNLVIKEICEGRLLSGGKIQRTEFFQSPDSR